MCVSRKKEWVVIQTDSETKEKNMAMGNRSTDEVLVL